MSCEPPDFIEEFIKARLDEDQQIAVRACLDFEYEDWTAVGDSVDAVSEFNVAHPVRETYNEGVAVHVARHDPARLLRQCDALRTLVGYHAGGVCGFGDNNECLHCDLLPTIAAIWSDHELFDPGWRQ